jgi:RimJ/RimL family protein N-acetyltransferase
MLGPRVPGRNGVSLAPPRLDDYKRYPAWAGQPEITYFWGPRAGDWTEAALEERFKEDAKSENGVSWAIHVEGSAVGLIGLGDIDWVRRQGESFIFIGELALQRRGVASEAIRLRTEFAFRELNLHRVYNSIVYDNVASRRANEKAGYREQGRIPRAYQRGRRVHDVWLGEILKRDWEKGQST